MSPKLRGHHAAARFAALLVLAAPMNAHGQPGGELAGNGGSGLGLEVRRADEACISPAQRAAVEAEVAANSALLGLTTRGPGAVAYTFWPQAGTLGRDLFVNNFVDLDATTGIRDYACADWTYDGHTGHDIALRSFSEQAGFVPIFAAADGTVVGAADGSPDMNTSWNNQPANYVILDHGGGHRTYYWHMKLGSVAVSVGQSVRAGQQLGLTGSSGISTGPHLHFETSVNGVVYEPFAGSCRTGSSGWVAQPNPDRTTTYLHDVGFLNASLSSYAGPPAPFPRTSHAAFSDSAVYYWMVGANLPPGALFQFRFLRPDGTLSYASMPSSPSFATAQYRWFWAWYGWNIPEIRSIAGTWHVQILINSVLMVDEPIEVLAVRNPGFNRAPNAATLAFDPPVPSPGNAVFCRVTSSMLLDDPDYDVVRYRYVWRSGTTVLRDVTSAAYSDAIPKLAMVAGRPLICSVTPTDGLLNGPTTVINSCRWDINNTGTLDVQDIFDFLSLWFGAEARADFDGAPGLSVQDIFAFLSGWFQGC